MSTPTSGRPRPVSDDPDSAGFWAAARRGELVLRVCVDCGQVLHLPKAYCDACQGWKTEWREVSGQGRVYSSTVVEHQVHPAFPVPYTIVLVEVEEGARLLGMLPGRQDLPIGNPMRVCFETLGDGTVLPQWEPA